MRESKVQPIKKEEMEGASIFNVDDSQGVNNITLPYKTDLHMTDLSNLIDLFQVTIALMICPQSLEQGILGEAICGGGGASHPTGCDC